MTQPKPRVLVIVGPTASGKSDLAVKLAREVGGEVISADSRQVYRGLDIGTGKITRREMRGIPHHLLDVTDPRRTFTAERYRILARRAITDISGRGKLPIICGGTGFYIDAALNDQAFPAVRPNMDLRKKLAHKSPKELLALLKRLDPIRARAIVKSPSECNNTRRIIRAIEIATAIGEVPRISRRPKKPAGIEILMIGIDIPTTELKERIRTRLEKRLRAGMIAEVRRLHEPRSATNPHDGLSWRRLDQLGLEYRYVALYLQGKLTKAQLIDKLTIEIGRYAKRQMTWFKRDRRIKWLKPDEVDSISVL